MAEAELESGGRSPSSSCFMADRRRCGSPGVRFGVGADMLKEPGDSANIQLR